MEDTAAASC